MKNKEYLSLTDNDMPNGWHVNSEHFVHVKGWESNNPSSQGRVWVIVKGWWHNRIKRHCPRFEVPYFQKDLKYLLAVTVIDDDAHRVNSQPINIINYRFNLRHTANFLRDLRS